MPLLEISQSRQQGCGRAVRKKSCSQGAANDFHAGGRGGAWLYVQFCHTRKTVLRTGKILTLHPRKGAAKLLSCLVD
jgi:hypothetical protein